MAITTIINYDVNGNQDITLELTDYNDTNNTITDFRYADAYNGLANWFTFSSVVIEEPSATDVSNGYSGYKKLVGFGRSGDGANMIFFISPLSNLNDSQSVTLDMLLLAGDWSSLWYTSGFVNATYSGIAAAPTPETTFEHHWSFDYDDAQDDVGSGHGVNNGALFQSLDGRTVATFDGVNDYIQIPDPAALSGDTWTIVKWMKTDKTSGRQEFLSQWYVSGANSSSDSLGMGTDGGLLKAYYRENGGSLGTLTGPNVADNNWHHIAYVKDSDEIRIYVDGSEVDQAAFSGSINSSSDLFLGVWSGDELGYGKDLWYDGSLDGVRIYSMALTGDMINDLYIETTVAPPAPTPETTLVGHWSFDNGDATADVGTDGAATGVDFITDSGRTVASFDASSGEKIHFGDVDEVDFGTGDFSVGAWVNFNSISTGAFVSPVVYKGLTSLANWNGYALSAYQGQMRFMIGGANGWIRAEAPITAGDWHHVVGTREGAVIKLYIDGSLVDTQTDSLTRDVSTHLPLTFGSINNGTEYNGLLDAMVDDVRAYSMALDASQVDALYNSTTVSPPATPIQKNGYYPLYENESDANGHAGGNGTSHSHVFDGVTYYMPNGLVMGDTQFHGNYGLIAKYALDNNSDDSVGTNNLSLVGGSVSYVGYGTNQDAVEFNYGELESDNVVDLTGAFTISFWAYEGTPYAYSGNNYSSFFKWGTAAGSYFDFYLLNGKIRTLHNNATSGWGDNRGSVAVPAGWNHYAMTIDPSTGSKIVYLNGVAQTLTGPAFTGTFASSQKVYLGNVSNDSAFRSNGGQMDDVRIWDRVLEASEIATIAAEGADETTVVPLSPSTTGNYYGSTDAGAIIFENIQSNADGITAGATQWAYSTSPLGDVGQAHGGTAVAFGSTTVTGLPESSSLTLYYGLIDASGLVIWKSSLAENTLEKVAHTLTLWDSYGDGYDGTYLEIYDSNGATYFSTTQGPPTLDLDGDGDVDRFDGQYGTVLGVNLPHGDYTWALVGGAYPLEHSFTFVRNVDNFSVATSSASDPISGSFTVGAAAVTGYDWTHGGQLTNIVKFSRGVDALGNPSFAYAKKEDDNTATLYLTTDIQDFAQFSSNATGATGIVGSPVCMEYGPGKLFMGTSTGNAYEIEFNGNTITSVLELHAMAGGESVREAKYDSIQNQWIFEAGEKIFTVVPGTTTAVERYVLPSGAKCMDIAAGDSGVAIIIKRADHSLAPIIATAGWTEIASEEAMVASLNSIGVADFNYDYVMDKWVAASASGQILQADDLLQFLGGTGSPPLPG